MNDSESNTPGAGDFREEFARMITRPEEDLDLGRGRAAGGRGGISGFGRIRAPATSGRVR